MNGAAPRTDGVAITSKTTTRNDRMQRQQKGNLCLTPCLDSGGKRNATPLRDPPHLDPFAKETGGRELGLFACIVVHLDRALALIIDPEFAADDVVSNYRACHFFAQGNLRFVFTEFAAAHQHGPALDL